MSSLSFAKSSCNLVILSNKEKITTEDFTKKQYNIHKVYKHASDYRLVQHIEFNTWILDLSKRVPTLRLYRKLRDFPYRPSFVGYELKSRQSLPYCEHLSAEMKYYEQLEEQLGAGLAKVFQPQRAFQWGKFFLMYEARWHAKNNRPVNYAEASQKYNHAIQEIRKEIDIQGGSFLERINLAKLRIFEVFNLENYCNDGETMTNAILKGCTECEGNTTAYIAAMNDLFPTLPQDYSFGLLQYDDHVEPVLYSRSRKAYVSLVSGGPFTTEIEAPIFESRHILNLALRDKTNLYQNWYLKKLRKVTPEHFLLAAPNTGKNHSVIPGTDKFNLMNKPSGLLSNSKKSGYVHNGDAPKKGKQQQIPIVDKIANAANSVLKGIAGGSKGDLSLQAPSASGVIQGLWQSVSSLFASEDSSSFIVAENWNKLIHFYFVLSNKEKKLYQRFQPLFQLMPQKPEDFDKSRDAELERAYELMRHFKSNESILSLYNELVLHLSKKSIADKLSNSEFFEPVDNPVFNLENRITIFLDGNQKSNVYDDELSHSELTQFIDKEKFANADQVERFVIVAEAISAAERYLQESKIFYTVKRKFNQRIDEEWDFSIEELKDIKTFYQVLLDVFTFQNSINSRFGDLLRLRSAHYKNKTSVDSMPYTFMNASEELLRLSRKLAKNHRKVLMVLNNWDEDKRNEFFRIFNLVGRVNSMIFNDEILHSSNAIHRKLLAKKSQLALKSPLFNFVYQVISDPHYIYTVEPSEEEKLQLALKRKALKTEFASKLKNPWPSDSIALPTGIFTKTDCEEHAGKILSMGNFSVYCPDKEPGAEETAEVSSEKGIPEGFTDGVLLEDLSLAGNIDQNGTKRGQVADSESEQDYPISKNRPPLLLRKEVYLKQNLVAHLFSQVSFEQAANPVIHALLEIWNRKAVLETIDNFKYAQSNKIENSYREQRPNSKPTFFKIHELPYRRYKSIFLSKFYLPYDELQSIGSVYAIPMANNITDRLFGCLFSSTPIEAECADAIAAALRPYTVEKEAWFDWFKENKVVYSQFVLFDREKNTNKTDLPTSFSFELQALAADFVGKNGVLTFGIDPTDPNAQFIRRFEFFVQNETLYLFLAKSFSSGQDSYARQSFLTSLSKRLKRLKQYIEDDRAAQKK